MILHPRKSHWSCTAERTMFINNTNPWNIKNKTKQKQCDRFCTLIQHCDTVVSFYPFLCVDATGYFLHIFPSFLFPFWLPFLAWLFGLTFSNTWVRAPELNSSLVWEMVKAAQSHLLRMQPSTENMEIYGTKELLSCTAVTEQLTKSQHPHFASKFKGLSQVKTSGYAMLCDRIGLNEESCSPHLSEISPILFESWYTLKLYWSYFS